MRQLFFIFMLLVNCSEPSTSSKSSLLDPDSDKSNPSDEESDSPLIPQVNEPKVNLLTAEITRKSNAQMEIECGDADKMLISFTDDKPELNNPGWMDCASQSFNFSLYHGENEFSFWFKEGDKVFDAIARLITKADAIELIDANPSNNFGFHVIVLKNGNIVVSDHEENGLTGSVKLYSGKTYELIKTIDGWISLETFGYDKILGLENSNFIIADELYDDLDAGGVNHGYVGLFSGTTGEKLGEKYGANANDQFSRQTTGDSIFPFANGNFVVVSSLANNAILFNGTKMSEIGRFLGTVPGDLVNSSAHLLENGNYVLTMPSSDDFGADAGCVVLLSKQFVEIDRICGSVVSGQYGVKGIITFANGNFAVCSPFAALSRGTVELFNGSTGDNIASFMGGTNDQIGSAGCFKTSEDRIVTVSPFADNAGNVNTGAIHILDTENALTPVPGTIYGPSPSSTIGNAGYHLLKNGNFLIKSNSVASGRISLYDGQTGGSPLVSYNPLGTPTLALTKIAEFADGSFLIGNEDGGSFEGTVEFVDEGHSTYSQEYLGAGPNFYMGSRGLKILESGNILIASSSANSGEGGFDLINSSFSPIRSYLEGPPSGGFSDKGVFPLVGGNFLVISGFTLEPTGNGSARLYSGTTGTEIYRWSSHTPNEFANSSAHPLANGDVVVVSRNIATNPSTVKVIINK